MKKTDNVKATKLMIDDHIKVAGTTYRINMLSKTFGRGRDMVRVYARTVDQNKSSYINLQVPATTRFTIFNQ